MRVLELFSGTHSVGKVASALGYEVVSLDLSDATICCNILEWDYKTAFSEGYFDIMEFRLKTNIDLMASTVHQETLDIT